MLGLGRGHSFILIPTDAQLGMKEFEIIKAQSCFKEATVLQMRNLSLREGTSKTRLFSFSNLPLESLARCPKQRFSNLGRHHLQTLLGSTPWSFGSHRSSVWPENLHLQPAAAVAGPGATLPKATLVSSSVKEGL